MQETWREWRREGKLSKSTMEEREAQKCCWLKKEEGVFIGGENMVVGTAHRTIRP
jgi:hypothetical protein